MENTGIEIKSVILQDNNIEVTYENGAVEILPNNLDTYKAFYNLWLKDNPPFISDVNKIMMRNIILASAVGNTDSKCINDLQEFFSTNPENVKKFLTYMRKRVDFLPEKKSVWRVVTPAPVSE
jgi:hypothetical protein